MNSFPGLAQMSKKRRSSLSVFLYHHSAWLPFSLGRRVIAGLLQFALPNWRARTAGGARVAALLGHAGRGVMRVAGRIGHHGGWAWAWLSAQRPGCHDARSRCRRATDTTRLETRDETTTSHIARRGRSSDLPDEVVVLEVLEELAVVRVRGGPLGARRVRRRRAVCLNAQWGSRPIRS